jgi:hypothetical protein
MSYISPAPPGESTIALSCHQLAERPARCDMFACRAAHAALRADADHNHS